MSVSVCWKPYKDSGILVKGAKSSFVSSMETVFGPQPWILDHTDIPILLGMASVETSDPNPYQYLREKLESGISIEVFTRY